MKIKTLILTNFRLYENLEINFNNNINIFIGNNAQGKTTLLESIYLLAISKSHKTHRDKELIKFNEMFSKASCVLETKERSIKLDIIISHQGKKVLINDVEKRKISEYIGAFNVVFFAPEDLGIVKGDPSLRRKFIDVEIGQISPIYIYHLNQYNRILRQRNEYLKQVSTKYDYDMNYLDTLTRQLSLHGSNIMNYRLRFIKKLNYYANSLQKYISNNQEKLELQYKSSYNLEESNISFDNIFQVYKKNYQKDILKGNTNLGIQRDDIRFIVNGIDVSNYGSQGQQRTTALALKLSLIDFIKNETNNYPIVLLDDVLSELDDIRQTKLLNCLTNKVQTFITTTNISGINNELIDKADIYYIENAQIIKRKGDNSARL